MATKGENGGRYGNVACHMAVRSRRCSQSPSLHLILRLCFKFIFCSRFRFSSLVPSPIPLFRATHHASCTSFPAPDDPMLRLSASFFVSCTPYLTTGCLHDASRFCFSLSCFAPCTPCFVSAPSISLPVTHTTLRFASRLGVSSLVVVFRAQHTVSRTPHPTPLNL